jgi:hypothetical protein
LKSFSGNRYFSAQNPISLISIKSYYADVQISEDGQTGGRTITPYYILYQKGLKSLFMKIYNKHRRFIVSVLITYYYVHVLQGKLYNAYSYYRIGIIIKFIETYIIVKLTFKGSIVIYLTLTFQTIVLILYQNIF